MECTPNVPTSAIKQLFLLFYYFYHSLTFWVFLFLYFVFNFYQFIIVGFLNISKPLYLILLFGTAKICQAKLSYFGAESPDPDKMISVQVVSWAH